MRDVIVITAEQNEEWILNFFANMSLSDFIGYKSYLLDNGLTPKQFWDEHRKAKLNGDKEHPKGTIRPETYKKIFEKPMERSSYRSVQQKESLDSSGERETGV